jgi:hypothetical protein
MAILGNDANLSHKCHGNPSTLCVCRDQPTHFLTFVTTWEQQVTWLKHSTEKALLMTGISSVMCLLKNKILMLLTPKDTPFC